jgi:hypothetical protein
MTSIYPLRMAIRLPLAAIPGLIVRRCPRFPPKGQVRVDTELLQLTRKSEHNELVQKFVSAGLFPAE